ncbi:MAG: hypothetical protein GX161_07865 [Firmicutes bacterium]|jgi:uncharacterized protein YbjT (DUF2867 family)|nr:hypothetical protein [Bacillota bacterium]
MRILLLGSGGPQARAVVHIFARQGYAVQPAAQARTAPGKDKAGRLELLTAPIPRTARRLPALLRCDAVVFLPPLHRSDGAIGQAYAAFAGLLASSSADPAPRPRIVMQSFLGAQAGSVHAHLRAAWRAEQTLRDGGFEHVILRSGPVWDPELGPLAALRRFVRLWGRLPLPGPPDGLVQPVALANLAEGIAKAVRIPAAPATTFDAAGPDIFRLRDLARLVIETFASPGAKEWYIGGRPVLRRALRQARALLPPWLVGCTCNPEAFFRTLCIRPQRVFAAQHPQPPAAAPPRTESTLN